MRKILFLDIDGVIAIPEPYKKWGLNHKRQILLGKILKETNCEIVISSSWRKHNLIDTKQYFLDEGFMFTDKIIGVTIRAYHYLDKQQKIHLSIPRGVEIKQWIDTNIHSNNGKDFKRQKLGEDFTYCILDDDKDMLLEHINNFVKTDTYKGLTIKDTQKVINILNHNHI